MVHVVRTTFCLFYLLRKVLLELCACVESFSLPQTTGTFPYLFHESQRIFFGNSVDP